MALTTYLDFLTRLEHSLAASYRTVSAGYPADNDVFYAMLRLAGECDTRAGALAPVISRLAPVEGLSPERLHAEPVTATRGGPLGLLRDLQDLYQLANLTDITWTLVGQAAYGARDRELIGVVRDCAPQVVSQVAWLRTRMKAAAPQTLLMAT